MIAFLFYLAKKFCFEGCSHTVRHQFTSYPTSSVYRNTRERFRILLTFAIDSVVIVCINDPPCLFYYYRIQSSLRQLEWLIESNSNFFCCRRNGCIWQSSTCQKLSSSIPIGFLIADVYKCPFLTSTTTFAVGLRTLSILSWSWLLALPLEILWMCCSLFAATSPTFRAMMA